MRRLGKASRLLREHDRQGGKNWGKTGEKLGTPHPFTEFEILPKPAHSHSMGRIGRVVAVGEAHHITHHGIAQQPIFHSEPARSTYLHLLGEQAARHKLRLLGYCLMTNHVHWLAVPEHPDALARIVRFVHGPYAQ